MFYPRKKFLNLLLTVIETLGWTTLDKKLSTLDKKLSTLDQKWSNPKFQVGTDLVHPGPLWVQPENTRRN